MAETAVGRGESAEGLKGPGDGGGLMLGPKESGLKGGDQIGGLRGDDGGV